MAKQKDPQHWWTASRSPCCRACPTLVLCGRQDNSTPLECHEEIAAAVPGAKLVVIEDCGHLSPKDRPDEVTAVLRDWPSRW